MEAVNQYRAVRAKKPGRLAIAAVQLAISYLLVSLAINDGNLLVYLIAFILLVCGIKNILLLIKSLVNDGKH